MEIKDFRTEESWAKRLNQNLDAMSEHQVIEYNFEGMPKKTFMVYIERANRLNKPEKHWRYKTKPCKTGAFIARDV